MAIEMVRAWPFKELATVLLYLQGQNKFEAGFKLSIRSLPYTLIHTQRQFSIVITTTGIFLGSENLINSAFMPPKAKILPFDF